MRQNTPPTYEYTGQTAVQRRDRLIAVAIVMALAACLLMVASTARAQYQPCVWPNRCAAK